MENGRDETESKALASNGDYLWDRSGEPDPEIQKLEVSLARFRHHGTAPVFPQLSNPPESFLRWRMLVPVFATIVAVMMIALVVFLRYRKQAVPATVVGWDVSSVAGAPLIGPTAIRDKAIKRLAVGQILETDPQSRASLHADDTGQIEVEASTRLRLVSMDTGLKRIALDRGTIHAFIWAPPGQFVVDTPSAMTVDLGCAYTLQVDDSGRGLVRTSLGWVGFKLNGRESFIPAGAACVTKPKVGPGTPYFEDASSKFRAALARFDSEDNTPEQRAQDLAIVLKESRKRDTLTLWHLLSRVPGEQRGTVYESLRQFAPPPANVTKQGILSLERPMLDLWWNQLGFDDISVWRHWERSWDANPTAAPGK